MEILQVPIHELKLDPDNTRQHGDENLAAIAASLLRFGQIVPLVVRHGVVVGGNATLRMLKQHGWESVWVTQFNGTYEEARALSIALNRTAELASWNEGDLVATLEELAAAGWDSKDLGFEPEFLEQMPPIDDFSIPAEDMPEKEREPPIKKEPGFEYRLIFDDGDQQKRFFAFLRWLHTEYPEDRTTAGRLDLFLASFTLEGTS